MMLRRAIACFALLSPLAFTLVIQGCGEQSLPQDICNWIADSNNCYQRYANDVDSVCGTEFVVGNDPLASATGFFQERDDLSVCTLSQGGLVTFGSAPTFDMFPLSTISFTVLDFFGVECGSAEMFSTTEFKVTINMVDANDPGTITNPDGTPLTDDITGGTFETKRPTADQLDVICPGGNEMHNFNVNTLEKCAELAPFQPRVILESSPGAPESLAGPAVAGFIRFVVEYPPVDPSASGAQPRRVQYFNCQIPAPPPPCLDGSQNFDETDVDCGGDSCAKCEDGLKCLVDDDCLSANCGLNMGLRQCLP